LNKNLLLENLDKPYAIMFFYQTKEAMPFEEMNEKTVLLFEKFIKEIKPA
jgi:ribonuclease P protein component